MFSDEKKRDRKKITESNDSRLVLQFRYGYFEYRIHFYKFVNVKSEVEGKYFKPGCRCEGTRISLEMKCKFRGINKTSKTKLKVTFGIDMKRSLE